MARRTVRAGLHLHPCGKLVRLSLPVRRTREDPEAEKSPHLRPVDAGPTAPVPVWAFPAMGDMLSLTFLALLLALHYWSFPHLKHGLLFPLFSRIHKDAALDNETRAAIVAAVEAEPGIHDRELQRRLALAGGRLRHHLDKLVDAWLLTRQRPGRFTGYWPHRHVDDATMAQAALLRTPLARQIHELLQEDPGLSQTDLAARLGKSRQSVGYHMRRLRSAGLGPEAQ